MRSAKSMKSFSFSAVASPTYDDHLDASFDDYSNYVDEVTIRLSTARDLTFAMFILSLVSTRPFSICCVHSRKKEVLTMYHILMTTLTKMMTQPLAMRSV